MRQQSSFWLFILWIFSTISTNYATTNDPIMVMAQCSNTAQNGSEQQFWMDKFNSLGLWNKFSDEAIGMKFIYLLNNLQQLLEHDGNAEQHHISAMECIRQNDPTLYQVIFGLVDTVIKAKHAIMEDGSYDLLSIKAQLEFAAMFLAKRGQISWPEIIPLNGINNENQDGLLWEALTLWDQQKCDEQNEWDGHGKQNRQNSYQKRILRFTLTAIEDAEKIMQKFASKKRRRRRRRKRANDEPPYIYDPWSGRNYTRTEWQQLQREQLKSFFISMLVLITVATVFFCMYECATRRQRAARQRQVIAGAQQPVVQTNRLRASQQLNPRMGTKIVEEFNKFPTKYVGTEERECSICLINIESRSEVRPMPACKHVFHGSCIELWLHNGHTLCPLCRVPIFFIDGETIRPNNQNVAGSYENGVVPQIELTILDENQNVQPAATAGSSANH